MNIKSDAHVNFLHLLQGIPRVCTELIMTSQLAVNSGNLPSQKIVVIRTRELKRGLDGLMNGSFVQKR